MTYRMQIYMYYAYCPGHEFVCIVYIYEVLAKQSKTLLGTYFMLHYSFPFFSLRANYKTICRIWYFPFHEAGLSYYWYSACHIAIAIELCWGNHQIVWQLASPYMEIMWAILDTLLGKQNMAQFMDWNISTRWIYSLKNLVVMVTV